MSQVPAPVFKIKLKTAKIDGDQTNAPAPGTLENQKPVETSLQPPKNVAREDSIQNSALTSKPSGVIKLKVKQSSGPIPLIGTQTTSKKRPPTTDQHSLPKKPKLAKKIPLNSAPRSGAPTTHQPGLNPPAMSSQPSGGFPKLKLKLGSYASIVSSGSGPVVVPTSPQSRPPSSHPRPPHPRPHLHHRHPGPKKRGRGRPPNIGGRPPRRPEDEVRYHIPNLPPRSFSLRHSASHSTFDDGIEHAADTAMADGGGALQSPVSVTGRRSAMDERSPGGVSQSPVVLEPFGGDEEEAVVEAKKEDLEKLLNKIWDKDTEKVFRQPVTEEMAPGYSSVITTPMDLSTIKTRLEENKYSSWGDIAKDLELMFGNALKYNPQGDAVWRYAHRLRNQASSMLKNAKAGKTAGGRTATATAKRKETAAAKAAHRAKRDAERAAARAEQRAAQEAKVLKRAGVSNDEEETARSTFKAVSIDAGILSFGGLGSGASADGAPLGFQQQCVRPTVPVPNAATYVASLMRFAGKLKGKAMDMVMAAVKAVRTASMEVGPMPIFDTNKKEEGTEKKEGTERSDSDVRPSSAHGLLQPRGSSSGGGKRGRPKGSTKAHAAAQQAAKNAAMAMSVLPPPLALSATMPAVLAPTAGGLMLPHGMAPFPGIMPMTQLVGIGGLPGGMVSAGSLISNVIGDGGGVVASAEGLPVLPLTVQQPPEQPPGRL